MNKKLFFIIVILFIGCSQSNNSSDSVVSKFINGFINSNVQAIWEASNDAYLNDLLTQPEKDSSFVKFSDKFDENNYPLFNKDIIFNIKKSNKIHDTHIEIFVEITYLSENSYIINQYQSAKKTLVKINTKQIKSSWTVDKINLEEILEYNKEFDMQKTEMLITKQIDENLTNAINTYQTLSNSYSDYFDNLDVLKQEVDNAKQNAYSKEKQMLNSGNYNLISVYSVKYVNEDYGSYIKGTVKNNFTTSIINVEVKAEFETQSYSMSGYDCNSLKYPSKHFTKHFTIKNIYPGQSKSFEEFYALRVSGSAQRGYCFHLGGQEGKIMGIKYNTLTVKPYSVNAKGKN